jgi:hypothetical protein
VLQDLVVGRPPRRRAVALMADVASVYAKLAEGAGDAIRQELVE